MRMVRDSGAAILSQEFDNVCSMTLEMRADRIDELTRRITEIDGTSIQTNPLQ